MIPYCVCIPKIPNRHGYIASGLDRCIHFTVKSRSAFRGTVPLRVRVLLFLFFSFHYVFRIYFFSHGALHAEVIIDFTGLGGLYSVHTKERVVPIRACSWLNGGWPGVGRHG